MISPTHQPQKTSPWKSQAERRYEEFVSRLSPKGKNSVQKHMELCEADPAQGCGELWKRFAGTLSTIAPHEAEMSGLHSVKFFIADGKYRQQVFALEDNQVGTISVYLPDVLARAIEKNILTRDENGLTFKVVGEGEMQIQPELITAETRDMTLCKAMVGWGRRAIRLDLNVLANEKSIRAIELLCELAAETWAAPPQ